MIPNLARWFSISQGCHEFLGSIPKGGIQETPQMIEEQFTYTLIHTKGQGFNFFLSLVELKKRMSMICRFSHLAKITTYIAHL